MPSVKTKRYRSELTFLLPRGRANKIRTKPKHNKIKQWNGKKNRSGDKTGRTESQMCAYHRLNWRDRVFWSGVRVVWARGHRLLLDTWGWGRSDCKAHTTILPWSWVSTTQLWFVFWNWTWQCLFMPKPSISSPRLLPCRGSENKQDFPLSMSFHSFVDKLEIVATVAYGTLPQCHVLSSIF